MIHKKQYKLSHLKGLLKQLDHTCSRGLAFVSLLYLFVDSDASITHGRTLTQKYTCVSYVMIVHSVKLERDLSNMIGTAKKEFLIYLHL